MAEVEGAKSSVDGRLIEREMVGSNVTVVRHLYTSYVSNAAFKVRQQISISRHWRSSQFALPRLRIRIPERSPADHEVGVPISCFSLITAIEYSVNDASFVGRGEKKRRDGGEGEAGTAVAHEEEVDEVDEARREGGRGQDADDASSLRDGISLSG
ncbi:hypothetical protein EAG_11455 [Camponotus floridanus]|uniref:Uncharacterized protein n=1 Tax=Camponotus floridanus TaxID=104421 RepID=E2A9N5_CAMFO|nr:hypothetical protein EAG_11455 [Camponotus floridanus]